MSTEAQSILKEWSPPLISNAAKASASSIGTWSGNSVQIGFLESCVGPCVVTPASLPISEGLAGPRFILSNERTTHHKRTKSAYFSRSDVCDVERWWAVGLEPQTSTVSNLKPVQHGT